MNATQSAAKFEENEFDPKELIQQVLRVAKNGRWWIPLFGLASLLIAVVGLSHVSDVYRSDSIIQIVEQQIPQNLVAPLSSMPGALRLQTITQQVLSRTSLLRIIEETHLYADKTKLAPDMKVDLMRKSLGITPMDVTREGTFTSFMISFSAPSPGLAQEVTRKLAALFIERHSETQAQRADNTAGFLKDRLTEKRKRAAELQRQMQDFKTRYAGDLPENRLANESKVGEYRMQLQNAISNLSRAKQQRIIWESMLSGNLNGRLTRLKSERVALLARLTPKHPQVIAKDEEISAMEHMVANLQTGNGLTTEQLGRLASGDQAIGQIQGQLDANRLEVENLVRDQKRFEALVAEGQRHLNLTPALDAQLSGMTREAEVLSQEISKLDSMEQQSGLSVDMERRQQGEQFRQLEPPALPLKPLSPARFRISAGAGVGGMFLGFAVAFLLDLRKGCLYTEEQIRRKYAPPLVLAVPEFCTAGELRARKWRNSLQWAASLLVMAAMLVVELYVYRHT